MRLKSIKLAGFKSFVDPTNVSFPSNLVAVVGPNGCGKSNIIDAVRWVMGESSAKNLRGEAMSDVIFNGSVNRKPIGQASIELVFDNSDGTLVGEYAGYTDIAIRRKVTREGQSEYFLNGTECRRKDITDIFLGTGLGPRSYAIIEQGMISRLIESKPEELRVFIEEAAGISKYKERRRETESRMRRTVENLERLTDLREELERQLQHLKRQADAAEKYTELKKDERLLKAQMQALQWQGLDEKVGEFDVKIRDLQVKLDGVIAEQRSIDADIERFRDEHIEFMDAFNEVQSRFYGLGADIARSEQSIQHQEERSRQFRDDLEQVEKNFQESEQHLVADSEKLEQWKAELANIAPELESAYAAEEQTRTTLLKAEELMHSWQSHWDEFNQRASQPKQQAEVQQAKIQQLEQMLERIKGRVDILEEEAAELNHEDGIETLNELKATLDDGEISSVEKQEQIEQLGQLIADKRESSNELGSELDAARGELQSLRGRQASLEALQQAALGQQEGAANDWLKNNALGANARLGENIKAASGWETAIETVLGDQLQAVCVDSLDAIANISDSIEKGHLTFVDGQQSQSSQSSGKAATLGEKILEGEQAKSLLAGIYAVDTLDEALAIRSTLDASESVVTIDGLWFGPNWLRVIKDADAQTGILARQEELESLAETIDILDLKVEQLEERREQSRDDIKQAELQREDLQKAFQQFAQQQSDIRSQLSANEARIEQEKVRREQIAKEISESHEQFELEKDHLSTARALLEEAIAEMEQDTEERERLLAEREQNRENLEKARESARQDKDSAHELDIRNKSLQTQLESMEQNIIRTRGQVSQLEIRRNTLKEAISGADAPLIEMRQALEEQLAKRLEVEQELSAARARVDDVEHSLRECETKRHDAEQRAGDIRTKLEGLRVESQGLQVSRRTLEEALIETQFDIDNLLENMPEEASAKEWQERYEAIGRKIARLGPINLAAIDEYKANSERKVYLDSQNDDLVEALNTLENAIARIDKETRQRFKDTFDKVNNSLQELFPKVFGGGTAYLEMTGDNLLDTGIAIMARPPGKRNSTIHLLSGGEKALTAIALVFSIFRLNPAPFCMLDEVDAPLDDANTGRYARLVKEMSEHVQFIFITHNKITMEVAEQLMGVTMHEPGVSRLVSVDIDAAVEMVEPA